MTGLEEQLAERIEHALGLPSFDGSSDASEALGQLAVLANQYLAMPIPAGARPAASDVAKIAGTGALPADDERRFRAALTGLRDALAEQAKLDEVTIRLAEDPELVQEFLTESREHLATVETGLLTLEMQPENAEVLNAVFRSFHTIKGLAAFLGASAIEELAHETESVLDRARSGKLFLSAEVIDLVLHSADQLTKSLQLAETCRLNRIPRCDGNLLQNLAAIARGELTAIAREEKAQEARPEGDLADRGPAASATPNSPENRMLRVEASKLEHLIDMVGELVIAESVVRHHPRVTEAQDSLLSRNLTQLARVVAEVQKTSLSMRMVAVGTLFRRMNRLIRDLSRKCGKPVQLTTVGDEVELDRGIVDDLADPIVHMIRNAVDHGLETPQERTRAGKAETGAVCLKASHDAGEIVIEISDDGRGLDANKILAKAEKAGLVREGRLREKELPDEDAVFRLIFEPGFSTAEKVTDLSGRGVGMDVVKKQVQKLRGRIAIRSVPGKGCTFVLRLPLTLAIIDGLVVGVGAQRYILPMFAVRELFSPGPETFVTIENRAEAALFRDKLLPVIRLSRLADKVSENAEPSENRPDGVLIVAEGRDRLFCIAVDQLIGKQEVVIKSLGKTYRDVPAIAGGSILGDGRVGLIIDVNSLRYRN